MGWMGINCPDIREAIHWGVSDDVEMYMVTIMYAYTMLNIATFATVTC